MTICLISAWAFLTGLAYFLVIRAVLHHWEKISAWEISANFKPLTRVGVLIAARNEAHNITTCLQHILQGRYPPELLEVLVIDDHSTDGTAELVRKLTASYPQLRLLPAPEGWAGKKAALRHGIAQTGAELIVTTDADCRVPPDWLSYFVSRYQAGEPAFIAAPVQFTAGPTLLQKFQALDMLGTMLITGAGIRSGAIHMSNGANLAYPRAVFQEVGGFSGIDHLASGDDMLLMHKIALAYPGRIAFLKNAQASVRTPAAPDYRAFIQQRLRWATKSGTYQNRRIIAVLALVFLLCWAILLSPLLALFFGWYGWLPFVILLFFKSLSDFRLLSRASRFFHAPELMKVFWPAQWLHIAYIAGIGLLANLVRQYEWKGRRLR